MGAAAEMQFFVVLGLVVVLGIYYWMYAAHSFVVVVDETAAGIDEVKWPDLPILDCAGRLLYLLWLAAMAAIPVWALAALALPALVDGPWGSVPVFIGAVWLIFPIMLLSALSGRSKLVVLHGGLLRRLVRRPFSLLVFYALSGLVLFGAGLFGIYALTRPAWLLLAAPVGASAVLIHARLIGRLAWLLGYRTPIKTKKKKPEVLPRAMAVADPWAGPEEPHAAPLPALPVEPPAETEDDLADELPAPPIEVIEEVEDEFAPRKTPYVLASGAPRRPRQSLTAAEESPAAEAEEDEWTPHKRPYGVLGTGEAPAPPPRSPSLEPPPDPYAIRAQQPPPVERPADPYAIRAHQPPSDSPPPDPSEAPAPGGPPLPEMPKPSEEVQLWLYVRDRPTPPRYVFFSGIFTFPGYPTVLRPLLQMCLLGLAWSFCMFGLVSIWPF